MVQNKLPLINNTHDSETRNIINELIKLFNGMGYTYDEALQKAHDVLGEAERINELNNNTNSRLDKIIADSGTSSTEVVDARGTHTVLSARLNENESEISERVQGANGKKVKMLGGVIRNVGNGFEFIHDSTHDSINFLPTIRHENSRIYLDYEFNAKKVISMTVTPDEAFSSQGYKFGVSVGTNVAIIYAYKTDNIYGYFTKSGGNTPVFTPLAGYSKGITSVEWDSAGNRLKINHEKSYSPFNTKLEMRAVGSTPKQNSFSAPGVASTQTNVSFYSNKSINGYVYYDGSKFVIDSRSIGIKKVTWDDTNKRAVIETEHIPTAGATVTSKTGEKRAIATSVGNDVIYVRFYDMSGTWIGTPDSQMALYINKSADNSQKIIPDDGEVLIFSKQGGIEFINAAEVISSNGNIWIEGIMEVN